MRLEPESHGLKTITVYCPKNEGKAICLVNSISKQVILLYDEIKKISLTIQILGEKITIK